MTFPKEVWKIPCVLKFTGDKTIISKAAMLLKQNEKPLTELVVNIAVSNSACAKVDARSPTTSSAICGKFRGS